MTGYTIAMEEYLHGGSRKDCCSEEVVKACRHPSCTDRQRRPARNVCYHAGRLQKSVGARITFVPGLMFTVVKK